MSEKRSISVRFFVLLSIVAVFMLSVGLQAQETTGGLQGTVKDAGGAVVQRANVELSGVALAGAKTLQTDAGGYYRFANLAPGVYSVTVKAPGFETLRRDGITIEVGHLPSLDLTLKVGAEATVVEVTAEAPLIDVTVTHTATNVTEDVISDIPHGRTFQSVIQFAPSARNEPLMGETSAGSAVGGNGGSMPGSSGNGLSYGFSVSGASDSENSYLVEGQDTENISGGYSKANVPFEFIQEVQVKSSGIEAEHGGALGGVVNVVMKKGSNAWHGELFGIYEGAAMDGTPNNYLRYDPTQTGTDTIISRADGPAQLYQPAKDHYRDIQPGGTIGGPIMKDRVWFFAGFAPYYTSLVRHVDFGSATVNGPLGVQTFTQDTQLYYGTARIDATLTQKIRVFGSWLTQYGRQSGASLPHADSIQGYLNSTINTPITNYSHGLGFGAPNETFNTGADITITPRLVSTTRFGYFFENYHDFGWPTQGGDLLWNNSGVGATENPPGSTATIPTSLQQTGGTSTAGAYDSTYTLHNANKHYQFDQDVAVFKSGWLGTHNFKFGYQLNHLVNNISQNGNVPFAFFVLGAGNYYTPSTTFGQSQCATLTAAYGGCAGAYGYMVVQDFATVGTASDTNHGLFFQDAWTIGRGVTINAGLRIEKEDIPAPAGTTLVGHSIDFSWGDKVAPRLGAAWDVFKDGRMKVFGSYGVTNDIFKLLLAETSFGGQAYEQCSYGVSTGNIASITPQFVNDRACPSAASNVGANFPGGVTPAGLTQIENINLRPFEPVSPGVKPYRQHESVFGVDYQLAKNWAFEARWDRRRLDHVIEDASLADRAWGETYTIVNPGEGVDKTFNGYVNYLTGIGQVFGVPGWQFNAPSAPFGVCASCPNMPKAARSYDGLEFRLTKSVSRHFSGMFSWTYSALRGNYTGLTTSDQIDGGAPGRNSPDTSRAFDEPFYYFGANGKSNSGPLPTDRPNTLKGFVYYQLSEGKRQTTTFGLFQTAYEGSPVSSYLDTGGMFSSQVSEAVYSFGRGKWVDAATDGAGNITLGNPTSRRTPWYVQSDVNLMHEIKVDKNNERRVFGFEANLTNLLNQHSVTAYYAGINSTQLTTPLIPGPGGVLFGTGASAYGVLEGGYNVQQWINGGPGGTTVPQVVKSSWYGEPFAYQQSRSIRLKIRYTF